MAFRWQRSSSYLMVFVVVNILFPGCSSSEPAKTIENPLPFRVLSANIGNPVTDDPHYALRLGFQSYEDYIGNNIRQLRPDIVFLQEVLPPTQCATFKEKDAQRTCFQATNRPEPVRRLLGTDYSIVCDARQHVECIGVHRDFATIEGVELGGFVLDGAQTPDLPLPSCSYSKGECNDSNCDGEATVSAITIVTKRGSMRVVHAHPNAGGIANGTFYAGEPCRYGQLLQVFDGKDSLVGTSQPALVAGDFNMDPESFSSDREKSLWHQNVGENQRFQSLGPPRDETGKYLPTRTLFAIDHVIGEGMSGSCKVLVPNPNQDEPGEQAGLDSGFDFSVLPAAAEQARLDHRSLLCDLVQR
jgi:endonuclease/exonuclease/phosphatase family metal-dependent hydrolase